MARVDETNKRILLKVVYCGPPGSGKTANLDCIYERTRDPNEPPRRPHATGDDGTHYDQLPIELGSIRGFATRMDLLTVPSRADYASARRDLLERTDGVIFVADSRAGCASLNQSYLHEVREHLTGHGYALEKLAYVLQVNHSDAPQADTPAVVATPLLTWHPDPASVPVHVGCAQSGQGVFESLKSVTKLCLMALMSSQKSG